jgi:DNA-binding transcriptional LysR family regulator
MTVDARLWAFLAVAREGRLTTAARTLNLSVSSVSQQIASLEHDFGVPLFIRGNRGTRLTPAGAVLLRHAEQIEAHWRQAFREAREVASGQHKLHCAASHTVTEILLPKPLGRFRQAYPEIRVHLSLANSADVAAMVETGQVDFGIAEGRTGHLRLRVTHLADDELGVVVASTHPWAGRESVTLSELLSADLILREPGSGTRLILEHALTEAGYAINPDHIIMELSSLRAILGMIRHNVGISVLSRMVVTEDGDDDQLLFLPVQGLRLRRTLYLLTRRDEPLHPAAKDFLGFLRAAHQGHGGHGGFDNRKDRG